ncbi:hypothetical protein AB1Y20_016910 [Prymnesium parvum]|uniref:Uncharacterized protein n=1 Tax=Prymnesium parvum TaxID=97485 RepID=A0AB34IAD3_PRYPA
MGSRSSSVCSSAAASRHSLLLVRHCEGAAPRASCERSYLPGGLNHAHTSGYHTPCAWNARSGCGEAAREACASLDEWHGCPRGLNETWAAMRPFDAEGAARWGCAEDGAWRASPSLRVYRSIPRARALAVTAELCRSFPWSNGKKGRKTARGPAVFGVDGDVTAAAGSLTNVSMLKMSMRPGQAWSAKAWTPCTNLAFAMCAARGLLPGQEGSRMYLATRGSDIMQSCRSSAYSAGVLWDECYVTMQEYCTFTRACTNGAQVWSTKGYWTCVPAP